MKRYADLAGNRKKQRIKSLCDNRLKQWEGVQANGLPTPEVNIIKRVVGFTVATITADNVKVNASRLSSAPRSAELENQVLVVNKEFENLTEINDIPALVREYARNAAVDGDGCMYTYWDADVDTGQPSKGAIKTEIVDNTRVFFGNPNDKDVQSQPFIQICSRKLVRNAKLEAKRNGISGWEDIIADSDDVNASDGVKHTDDKVTVVLTLWRDDESGRIWAYESTKSCAIRKPWDLGISLYPVCWLPWDYIKDCYHGQAMITGLIPNQIFINRTLAMSQLSLMRSGFPKYVYNKLLIGAWDNRVGGAIPVNGGDINNVAKAIDPPTISPQVIQFIQTTIELTEQSLGATSVALGDTRPDNTSAILALQRAASTPSEMTKQNLYKSIEDLYRIYLEFMANYYGVRTIDVPPDDRIKAEYAFIGQIPPDEVAMPFDFSTMQYAPLRLKIDVGSSSYYSEIASRQTLDNLLINKFITPIQYLERLPDGHIPMRRALISELKQQMMGAVDGMIMPQEPGFNSEGTGVKGSVSPEPEIRAGSGYGALQRKINQTGTTEGIV